MARETAPELRPLGAISEEGRTLGALFLNLVTREPYIAKIVIDMHNTRESVILSAPIPAEVIDWPDGPDELIMRHSYTDLVHSLVAHMLDIPIDQMLAPDDLTTAVMLNHKRLEQDSSVAKFVFVAAETHRFQVDQERAHLAELAATSEYMPPFEFSQPFAA